MGTPNFEEILDAVPDGIILVDSRGSIVYVNAGTERFFRATRHDLLGKSIELFVPERCRGGHPGHRAAYAAKPYTRAMEGAGNKLFARRLDGSEFPADISLSPLGTPEGPLVIAVVRDIADRVKLEEQLRQSQKVEALGQLAGGVAHDFNNLLTVISGYTEFALGSLHERDPLFENLREIAKAAGRAAELTRQLLAFGRRQIISPRELDLNPTVSEMEKLLRRLIGEHIELVTRLQPGLGHVKADPAQVEQVVINLAVNARDAMPKGGKLTIETQNVELDNEYARAHISVTPGPYVMLAMSDTGVGMDDETRSHLFEPFFTTKEPGKGTGLGLPTVHGIVKQSGGHIWVYSEPGRGTTFKVYFPRVKAGPSLATPETPVSSILAGSEILLLVEDEDAVRKLASAVLRGNGYTVFEASSGGEAILVSEKQTGAIHLMVTDVVMPQMSGRELAGRLRSARPGMKVLYMSGYTPNAIVHQGVLEEGMNFLQKPFMPDALLRKVRATLDSPSPG